MRKRMVTFIWALLFILSMTALTAGFTVYATSKKAVQSVSVRIDHKSVAKKIYTLEKGKSKNGSEPLRTGLRPSRYRKLKQVGLPFRYWQAVMCWTA